MNVDNMKNLNIFNSKLKNNDIALWFYANWCGHCKAMEEEWSKVEKNCKMNNIMAVKVRDDFAQKVKGGLGQNIMGFPKIVMISKGKEVAEHQGMRNETEIMNTILKHLKSRKIKTRSKSHKLPSKGCSRMQPKSRGKKSCGKTKHSKKNKLNNMKLKKLFNLLNQKKSKKQTINIGN
jgi:thioredoxin-like negative regulator of GroEL